MQPHTRSSSRRIWQPMGTLAALILALPCGAQRQPLVMTHGIRSNPTTWDQAAITLPGAFPVSIVRDTTTWTKSYFFQANELLDSVFTGLPDSTLAVGHSNGGLVLRQSILLNAPLRGLVTVGSPNKDAPAADAIRKNYMGDIISPILVHGQAISYALSPPDWTDPDEQWYYDYVAATGSNMIDLVNSILAAMEFDPSFEIWNSMYPSSAFMQSVGSPASLAIQHQRVPIRASIRTYIDDEKQAFWRLVIAPENVAYFEGIRDFASTIALLAGFYYTDKYCYLQPYQQGKCNASSLFLDRSTDLLLIEGRYCYKITVENAVGAYPFPCFASDAVLPLGNQTWGPVDINAPPDSALRLYDIQGPSHTEQPKSQAVRNSIEAFLQNQANVARCGLGPVYEVQIAAQSTDILLGSTTQLSVTAYDRCLAGLLFPPAIGSVSTSNPSVATVSAGTGAVNVSGISNGVATITVVMNGIAATRSVAVGAGTSLSVEVSGGPRENLSVGETVWLYANVTPSGQPVSYEWRVNGGAVISTASAYGHYFQGNSTISVTVTGSVGQTAYASAYLSGGGNEFRIQKHRPPVSGRP